MLSACSREGCQLLPRPLSPQIIACKVTFSVLTRRKFASDTSQSRNHGPEAQRVFLLALARRLGFPVHKLTSAKIRENGGAWILRRHKDSPRKMFSALFPELASSLEPWSTFPNIRHRLWWKEAGMQRKFFDWAARRFSVAEPAEWLKISPQTLKQVGGSFIFKEYGGSLLQALKVAYPELSWPAEDSSSVETPDKQRSLIEEYIRRKEMTLEAVQRLKLSDFASEPALLSLVRQKYGCSISAALFSIFPEHQFDIAQFAELPKDPDLRFAMIARYMKENLSTQLGITKLEDFYRISRHDVKKLTSRRLKEFETHQAMFEFLSRVYPDHTWERSKFSGLRNASSFANRSSQRLLVAAVRSARMAKQSREKQEKG